MKALKTWFWGWVAEQLDSHALPGMVHLCHCCGCWVNPVSHSIEVCQLRQRDRENLEVNFQRHGYSINRLGNQYAELKADIEAIKEKLGGT